MDYNDKYESCTSEIVKIHDHEQYLFSNRSYSDIIRDYVAVARQYVNDTYADSLERFMNSIVEQSGTDCEFCDYREPDTDVDVDELEAERDELLYVVNDVIAVLKKYNKKFKDKFRLQRLDIMPLIQELHKVVHEYE